MPRPTRSVEVEEMERLARAAFPDADEIVVAASAIVFSPYDRVEVFLTEDGVEGLYVVLSDRYETESEYGVIAGVYEGYSGGESVEEFPDLESALDYAVRRAAALQS